MINLAPKHQFVFASTTKIRFNMFTKFQSIIFHRYLLAYKFVFHFCLLLMCAINLNLLAFESVQAKTNQATILIVGDSLTAEYGLSKGKGWASLFANWLKQEKYPYRVMNASISGDTTSGGKSRLPDALKQNQPTIVIIALGGNDMLRGLPLPMTEQNLRAMIIQSQQAKAQVILFSMQAPPNYGKAFQTKFDALYANLAKEFKLPAPPFLLEGFATKREWFQNDNIHPTEAAQPTMLNNVLPTIKPFLKK